MALTLTSRSAWGAAAPKSRTAWKTADLDGIVQHWFGSPKAASTHAGCDDLLRSVQRTHMAPGGLGAPNGGSDIAYNIAVCPHGTAYTLRGWDTQTGANGTTDANRRYLAVVVMMGTGDRLTNVAKDTLKLVYAEAFRRGVAVRARTHGSITGSSCPGPDLSAFVASAEWKPSTRITRWEVDWTTPAGKRQRDPTRSWRLWSLSHPGAYQRGGVYFRRKLAA